jgi:hypothetical protein
LHVIKFAVTVFDEDIVTVQGPTPEASQPPPVHPAKNVFELLTEAVKTTVAPGVYCSLQSVPQFI